MRRKIAIGAGIAALGVAGLLFAVAKSNGHFPHNNKHEHDEVNMPGLLGENASAEESAELALMFRNFETITREVANLPNGIRTETRSSNSAVRDALISHSVGMIERVAENNDPKIAIQSPTLDIFFLHGEEIHSSVEVTDEGIVVIQTSDNPDLVAALQIHAAEVTAMADRGMAAVHEMMKEQERGH